MSAILEPIVTSQDKPPACLGRENLNRLVSLWDIVNQFQPSEFCRRIANLAKMEAQFQLQKSFTPEEWGMRRLDFAGQIQHAANDCHAVGFVRTWQEIERIYSSLAVNDNVQAYAMAARQLIYCLVAALAERRFLYVEEEYTQYVDQHALFGESVAAAFPSAASDIKQAGNCLAAECPTAAVFHLMRAAEYALRALAADRQISLPKNRILDLATWEDMLRQLEIAEQAIQGYPQTHARERQYEFYHGAMMEFKRFKNVFRNSVMHTREEYDRDEARSAVAHVRAFMNILAGEISEQKTTPTIWV